MRKLLIVLFIATTALAGAARAQFCPGAAPYVFTDVPANDNFCSYITWMAATGVTTGCQVIDATNRLYCPDDFVTRKQMAAFMKRQADAVMPLTCASGQVMKWSGTVWACSDDNAGGSGTVTSVLSGTGLLASPNPIVGAGSINLALSYQLPQSCANGQVAVSSGPGGSWGCGTEIAGTGTVTNVATGAGLTGGPITGTGTLAIATGGVTATMLAQSGCANGQLLKWNGSAWACAADNAGPANAFVQNGNAFGATMVLGTTDNNALDIRVNNARAMRYEPNAVSPNVIGGSPANNVGPGVRGATIGGGGVPLGDTDPDFFAEGPNRVDAAYGTVGGGYGNRAGENSGPFATVGGGWNNLASRQSSTVGGGAYNHASGDGSTIGGGYENTASGIVSRVGGGQLNRAIGARGTVGGGESNFAGDYGTVGGGRQNSASAASGPPGGGYSTVGGGQNNRASGNSSTVGGGAGNTAGNYGTVGGGSSNTAGESGTVGGGNGNTASGYSSTIAGGSNNYTADRSFAAGSGARADQTQCFVFANWANLGTANCLGAANVARFMVDHGLSVDYFARRADGGGERWVSIGDLIGGQTITTWTGASLSDGGVWTNASDRAAKDGFMPIDPQAVLEGVVGLPITRWHYRQDGPGVEHIGPTAQDFKAAFRLGQGDKGIGTVDADGVALAAIQGLNAKLESVVANKDAEIAALKREMADHRATYQRELADLRLAVEVLMARTTAEGRVAQTR